MEATSPELIVQILGQLGVGAIFVFIYFKERDAHLKKDDRINHMTDQLLHAYKVNATVIEKHNESIERLAKAMEETSRTMQEVKDSISDSKRSVDTLTQLAFSQGFPLQNDRQ